MLFADCLARHLISLDGEEGMRGLLGRILVHWDDVRRTWLSNDDRAFGLTLEKCAKDSDRLDLCAARGALKLRCDLPHGEGSYDFRVCAQIYRSILEYLTDADSSAVYAIAQRVAFINETPAVAGFDYIMALLLVELQIERGLYEEAIVTAKRNRSVVFWCPYSQYYVYQATTLAVSAKLIANSPEDEALDLSDRFCEQPFVQLSSAVNRHKGAFPLLRACRVSSLLPYQVSTGQVDQHFDDIWNGRVIQEIRRSILDGDFTYCGRYMCSEIITGALPKKAEIADPHLRDIIDNHKVILDKNPRSVMLAHDASCNLACPMCRTELFSLKNKEREALVQFTSRVILPVLDNAEVGLWLSEDGDPFFSKHYRELLRRLDPVKHAKVKLCFLTNGQLFTPLLWEELAAVRHLFHRVYVSIDAAEQATYEDVRRPGKWGVLLENLAFLSKLRRQGELAHFAINFVVQKKNFKEIPDFVRLGQALGVDEVVLQKLYRTSPFSAAEFLESDIFNTLHPEHGAFLEVLRDPILRSAQVSLYTVKPYFFAAQRSLSNA